MSLAAVTGAHSGAHDVAICREPMRTAEISVAPQTTRELVWHGQRHPCTRPGLQANSPPSCSPAMERRALRCANATSGHSHLPKAFVQGIADASVASATRPASPELIQTSRLVTALLQLVPCASDKLIAAKLKAATVIFRLAGRIEMAI